MKCTDVYCDPPPLSRVALPREETRRGLQDLDRAFQLGVLPLQLPDLPHRLRRHPIGLTDVDLRLPDPAAQRLGRRPQPGRYALIAAHSDRSQGRYSRRHTSCRQGIMSAPPLATLANFRLAEFGLRPLWLTKPTLFDAISWHGPWHATDDTPGAALARLYTWVGRSAARRRAAKPVRSPSAGHCSQRTKGPGFLVHLPPGTWPAAMARPLALPEHLHHADEVDEVARLAGLVRQCQLSAAGP